MEFLQQMRSPRLSFIQTGLSLFLGTMALMSSYWCVGKQKVPKPLCTPTKHSNCIPVPGLPNSSSMQFFWETGDDRFVFPRFHTGLFVTCEEDIYSDGLEEKCRGFHTLTPDSQKVMMWLSVSMELMYIGLLLISCTLLTVQMCIRTWYPSTQRWGQMLNAFAAVFTVLGGLIGMVAHMMFIEVFQTTISAGPDDFKPHSYGYSWAFYVAWFGFTMCMSAGVSTLNSYTKKVLMVTPRRNSSFSPCSFNPAGFLPPAPYYAPPNPAMGVVSPQSSYRVSHLSPYYDPRLSVHSLPKLTHSQSLPLHHSNFASPPHSHPAPGSPYHRLSLPSPYRSSTVSVHLPPKIQEESLSTHYQPEEDYSPL
ncbi:germ cell-specific gene 1-like protein [Thalassophryne amazonica]|uniref:germ cell-specific gene 1-like protein n=1 Tax=Thalassophryne amazonica TaxID=390379 RepID=UPI001470AB77|nr:germ cell-specific gene 1-like protein [Thalassophryne amazonica]